MLKIIKTPKRYHPKGFDILYEDQYIIVGNKVPGFLTVRAAWDWKKTHTIYYALNDYVRKGNSKSRKCVFVVHRLDQDTSGVLIFAKTPKAQVILKDDWKNSVKIYYAVVHGRFLQKIGTISSYLVEDEEYVMHSTSDRKKGKLAQTAYTVIKETKRFSLLKIELLTGRKNQIRVHLADREHPVVGDTKYGQSPRSYPRLALHSQSISFTHPFSRERLTFATELPEIFRTLIGPEDLPSAAK